MLRAKHYVTPTVRTFYRVIIIVVIIIIIIIIVIISSSSSSSSITIITKREAEWGCLSADNNFVESFSHQLRLAPL